MHHWDFQDSTLIPSVFILSPLPPPTLCLSFTLQISTGSFECPALLWSDEVSCWLNYFSLVLNYILQTWKLFHLNREKRFCICFYSLGWSIAVQLLLVWQVRNTGAMSIYSFLYCMLLSRMTNCWLTLLMGISHLFMWNKGVERDWAHYPLSSTFTSSETENNCSVYVSEGILRGQQITCPLSKHKMERQTKTIILRMLFFFPVCPTVKNQSKYFVSAPWLQLLYLLTP